MIAVVVSFAACGSGGSKTAKPATTTTTTLPTVTSTTSSAPSGPDVARLASYVAWCGKVQQLATSKGALTPTAKLQSDTVALLRQDPIVDLSAVTKRITAPYLAAAALLGWRDYCPADQVAKAAAIVAQAQGPG